MRLNWLRRLLFPIAGVYKAVTHIRNIFFDKGIFRSQSYDFPVIVVGNLNVGGTGKSPMVEYLIRLLKGAHNVATLSRGYRRESVGFVLANELSSYKDVGDEPLQFFTKYGREVHVAVDADRRNGIANLREKTDANVFILDDAFQHRKVKGGFNILLTKYGDLYKKDFILPAGNLRESRAGANRADIIVVTKCPLQISNEEMGEIKRLLRIKKHQKLFFAGIDYATKVCSEDNELELDELKGPVTLVTGIANPKPLLEYLNKEKVSFNHLKFKDHHSFSDKEIQKLAAEPLIITTEKDYMRLKDQLSNIYYLPIETVFINDKEVFDKALLSFTKK